jgi:hypothetical protein
MAFLSQDQVEQVAANSTTDSRYVAPSKLTEGKPFRFRFFGEALLGWEVWLDMGKGSSKPQRWELKPAELPANAKPDQNGKTDARFFIAGVVWDYEAERFSIMQITQKTLLDKLRKYQADEDYGDATGYDVKITRNVAGERTTYDLVAAPPKAVAKSIAIEFDEFQCNLGALITGEDPFAVEAPTRELAAAAA